MVKSVINAHALINAQPPIWTWKMAFFFFLQFLEKYLPQINTHWLILVEKKINLLSKFPHILLNAWKVECQASYSFWGEC